MTAALFPALEAVQLVEAEPRLDTVRAALVAPIRLSMRKTCPRCGAAPMAWCVRVSGDPEVLLGHPERA